MPTSQQSPSPTAAAPRPPLAIGTLLLLAIAALAVVGLAWLWLRRGAMRTWQAFARQTGGAFTARNRISPACVTGTLAGRVYALETALSYDDDAPYYHTRAATPLRNPAGFILGLRRKSLLEEAQTRRDPPLAALEDAEFSRRFIVFCNDSEHLPLLLTPEARRELARYSDVEIYARLGEIEWRRAGEVSDLRALHRLNALLSGFADTIESLPSRPGTLSERLADEARIAKGV